MASIEMSNDISRNLNMQDSHLGPGGYRRSRSEINFASKRFQVPWRTRTYPRPTKAAELKLLELWLGTDYCPFYKEAEFYLQYLKGLVDSYDLGPKADHHLHPDFHPEEDLQERVLWLICEVLETYRHTNGLSIDRVLQILAGRRALQLASVDRSDNELILLVFNIIAWITTLFVPSRSRPAHSFNIVIPCSTAPLRPRVAIEKSQRPLDELLRGFGDLFPKRESLDSNEDDAQLKFLVSSMNAATLRSLGSIEISWVDSLSAHLLFDPSARSLCLFRLPSVCKSQLSENSILAVLTQNLYLEGEEPGSDFSISKALREVMLSYALIFRDCRSSRNVYRSTERQRASFHSTTMIYTVDPVLDELCGFNAARPAISVNHSASEYYDALTHFPIFKNRLKKVKDYMDAIQPNRFVSMWQDRRDLRLWYTIWTVILLGIISITQATVSIVLAGLQLRVAEKAYDLQQKTPLSTYAAKASQSAEALTVIP